MSWTPKHSLVEKLAVAVLVDAWITAQNAVELTDNHSTQAKLTGCSQPTPAPELKPMRDIAEAAHRKGKKQPERYRPDKAYIQEVTLKVEEDDPQGLALDEMMSITEATAQVPTPAQDWQGSSE